MASYPAVTKAVIPAAGLGRRSLPATKAIPKEMLPVVDKPAIQYVVEEAVAAGLRDILLVTGRAKGALEDHFTGLPSWSRSWRPKATKNGSPASGNQRSWPPSTTPGRAPRGGWAMRCSARRTMSAVSRSRYCSAMTSPIPVTRCCST